MSWRLCVSLWKRKYLVYLQIYCEQNVEHNKYVFSDLVN